MSTVATQPGRIAGVPTAGARRRRFALQTCVLLLAITFACIFLGVISSSRKARAQIDLTGSRQHRLSERTLGILGSLDSTYDVVVAGDMRSVDPLGRARTLDVLDGFGRASERVRLRVIDTSSSAGTREFDGLMTDLAASHKEEIDKQHAAVEAAAGSAVRLAEALQRLSGQLLEARGVVKDSDANAKTLQSMFNDDAAKCRITAETLTRSSSIARAALGQRIAGTEVPAIDAGAAEIGASLAAASNDLAVIGQRADAISRASDVPEIVGDKAAPIAQSIRSLRETADAAAESVARLPVLPILAVARTLERTSAALVIGPPKAGGAGGAIRAIEFEELFPAKQLDSSGKVPSLDLRSRAEELVSTALVALGPAGERAPIVVFVHDMPMRLAPAFQGFTGLVSRLRLRGMETIEWATALDPDPPVVTRIDPEGKRPVVYATLASASNSPDAVARMKRIVDAQNRLVGDGKPMLISVNVSSRPSTRDPDPLTECLVPLGVVADTGRPLLRQVQGPNGRLVTPDQFTTEAVGGADDSSDAHLIARAVHGLRCHFPWPISLSSAANQGGTPTGRKFLPIIQVRDGKDVWGESEWLQFAQVRPQERSLVTNPPANDSAQDDASGLWNVVAAVEVPRSGSSAPQRAVVVGCAPWFLDDATQVQLGVVDGRPVLRAPGNIELFESSVYWLAGQDELIARSATAESVPLIPALGEGPMLIIRWMLIAGLPVIVLLIGAGWRLIRG